MHDLGSPLHAYDHARIRGARLTARRARAGETLRTLDGQQRELFPAMLVIADAEAPQGIAGIMGGADSEVRDDTTTIVLEAANFTRSQIMRTSQQIGLRSEASNRWEKGVDAHHGAARLACRRPAARAVVRRAHDAAPDRRLRRPAAAPAVACAHGARRAHHRARGVAGTRSRDPRSSRLRSARRAGHHRRARAHDALRRHHARDRRDRGDRPHLRARARAVGALGRLRRRPDGGPARAPHGRRRLPRRRPDRGPDALLRARGHAGPPRPRQRTTRAAACSRSPTRSRRTTRTCARCSCRACSRRWLATLPGAATTSRCSRSRTPTTPSRVRQLPREPWTFGAVMRGRLGGAAWRRAGEPASFFLGKGVLESILGAVGVTCRVEAMPATYDPFLHPGRKGFVQVPGEQALGFVGELHPLTARRYGLDDPIVVHRARPRPSVRAPRRSSQGAAALGVPAAAPGHLRRRRRRAPGQRRARGGARARAAICSATSRSSTSGATPRRSAPAVARWRYG